MQCYQSVFACRSRSLLFDIGYEDVDGGSEGGDPRVGTEEAEERRAAGAGEEAGAREPGANLHPRQQ